MHFSISHRCIKILQSTNYALFYNDRTQNIYTDLHARNTFQSVDSLEIQKFDTQIESFTSCKCCDCPSIVHIYSNKNQCSRRDKNFFINFSPCFTIFHGSFENNSPCVRERAKVLALFLLLREKQRNLALECMYMKKICFREKKRISFSPERKVYVFFFFITDDATGKSRTIFACNYLPCFQAQLRIHYL